MNALVKPHIAIDGIEIRTDAQGRFCLNDLHKASGNERKNEPSLFLSNKQTQELVQELITTGNPVVQKNHPVSVINGGNDRGTYVVKELVYSYAMWISAAFNLKVIRTFDAVATGQIQPTDPMQLLADPNLLRNALLTYSEKVIELEQKVEVMQPTIDAFDRIATADGSLCLTDAAKALQMRPKDFISFLSQKQWIYKRTGSAHYVGYQDKVQSGFLEHKVIEVTRGDGSNKITEQVRVTPKGLTRLSRLLGNNHV